MSPSSGVALWLDGSFSAIGTTPDEGKIKELADWLSDSKAPGVWATDRLPLVWEGGRDMADRPAACLSFRYRAVPATISSGSGPKSSSTVTWAGNPNKPVETKPDEPG